MRHLKRDRPPEYPVTRLRELEIAAYTDRPPARPFLTLHYCRQGSPDSHTILPLLSLRGHADLLLWGGPVVNYVGLALCALGAIAACNFYVGPTILTWMDRRDSWTWPRLLSASASSCSWSAPG